MKAIVTYRTPVESIGHVGVEGVKSVNISAAGDLVVAREEALDIVWAKGIWIRVRLVKEFPSYVENIIKENE